MTGAVIRIGTRGSLLATTQAGTVRDALIAAGHPAELKIVTTAGDVNMAPVERIGVGVFTQALRDSLAAGDCDLAVHSFKDLPTAPDSRFSLRVPRRENPFDALVSRGNVPLIDLGKGASVGTSAPRRRSQLAAVRPDLDLRPLRGNITTRMGYVDSGELDAVVLAHAGLARVGKTERIAQTFGPEIMLPSPAQGALALECLVGNTSLCLAIDPLKDLRATIEVTAERSFLAALEAGCTAPVGALARITDSSNGWVMRLEGCAAALDGSSVLRVRGELTGIDARNCEAAASLGRGLAQDLISRGATELMAPEH